MKRNIFYAWAVASAIAAAPAGAAEVVQNGDFSSGLTGWTSYTTANGTIAELPSSPGAPAPQNASVVSFDTAGSGANSALLLNAGAYLPPYGSSQQGGGVFQTFTTTGGIATFSSSIAAYSRTGNMAGGVLSVLLDGVVLDSFDFADIAAGATERGALGFTTDLAAGTYTLSLQATRPFAPGRSVNSQYFDNVSLDVAAAAVPEPATWAMMIIGFGGVGFAMRRRSRNAAIAVA